MTEDATRSDGELMGDFAATGDEAAFGELVSRHGPMVHSVCRRVLSDHHEAEDVAQAVFLTMAKKARGLKGDSSINEDRKPGTLVFMVFFGPNLAQ